MTPAELADHWEAEAASCDETAAAARSLDVHVGAKACAVQARQHAYQLRLVLGVTARGGNFPAPAENVKES